MAKLIVHFVFVVALVGGTLSLAGCTLSKQGNPQGSIYNHPSGSGDSNSSGSSSDGK